MAELAVRKHTGTAVASALVLGLSAGTALSADLFPIGEPTGFRVLDEARTGVMVHSLGYKEGDTIAINGELLTSPLPVGFSNRFLDFLLGPRLHLGGTVNVEGETSFAYAGLTWTLDVTNRFFVEGSFGGGVHNGNLESGPDDSLLLGCRALFRESASLGFRFSQNLSLMATVDHLSHAGLCSDFNNGITTVGGRLGYTF